MQLPLRYISSPDKLVGDIASTVAPNSWVAKNFDNTYEDRMQHREVMANPKYSATQKLGSSWSEGAGMANTALAGELGGVAVMKGAGYVAPYVVKGVNNITKEIPTVANNLKSLYYDKAPWTWKPNPNNYYRASRTPSIFSDIEDTNLIRAVSEKTPKGEIKLLTKKFPESDTYWAKGTPLDGLYSSRNQNYGRYVVEASDEVPFVHAVNQRTKQIGFRDNPDINYNPTHTKEMYVKPRASYGYDELGKLTPSKGSPLVYNDKQFKALQPHWFYGYKEIKLNPKSKATKNKQGGELNKKNKMMNIEKLKSKISSFQEGGIVNPRARVKIIEDDVFETPLQSRSVSSVEAPKVELKPRVESVAPKTFAQAFNEASKAGKKSFMWKDKNGKPYEVAVKFKEKSEPEKSKSEPAKPKSEPVKLKEKSSKAAEPVEEVVVEEVINQFIPDPFFKSSYAPTINTSGMIRRPMTPEGRLNAQVERNKAVEAANKRKAALVKAGTPAVMEDMKARREAHTAKLRSLFGL